MLYGHCVAQSHCLLLQTIFRRVFLFFQLSQYLYLTCHLSVIMFSYFHCWWRLKLRKKNVEVSCVRLSIFVLKPFFCVLKSLTSSSIKILQYLHNPGTRKGVYRYILMTYFPVIQTKANIFHVSTLPEPVCDKTTAKKRWSLPRIVFVDVQTTFRYMFPSSASQSLPSDDSKVFCAYNLGIPLPILESKDFKNLLRCLPP